MIELFAGVVIGLVLGSVFFKYRRELLVGIICGLSIVFVILLYIVTMPIRLFGGRGTLDNKIIREYDRAFHEADNMDEVRKINYRIKKFKSILDEKEKKKKDKETQEALKEAMWVI